MSNVQGLWMLLLVATTDSHAEEATELFQRESVFDRVEIIHNTVLEVPEIERIEERLGISGQMMDVGGVRLYVERMGPRGKTPLLVITGGPGTSHHYWHGYVDELERRYDLIYYDARGVGLSEYKRPTSGYSVMQEVRDIEGMRAKLGIDKWVLLGYSFGGLQALTYAMKYPDSTAGVILLSSVVPFDVEEGLGIRQHDFMSQAERERVRYFYSVGGVPTPPYHSDKMTPESQMSKVYNGWRNGDWKRRWMYKPANEKFAWFARYEWVHDKNYYTEMVADGDRYDFRGVFNNSPIPMLIFEGEWDVSFGQQKAALMASQLPAAEMMYSKHAGHRVFEDDPEAFYKTFHRFMSQDFEVDKRTMDRWKSLLPFMTGVYR